MALRRQPASRFIVRSLTPRLERTLGLVLRRDKVLNKGLREVIARIEALK
jgi:hypothetical protein